MAAFSAEAEVEFAPRPGLTLTLDEDEQQVTLAVVKPEDRIRIVAVSLQSSKPLSDVARAVGAQRLFHDGSEIDLNELVTTVHARVARSFKRQTGSPYLLAVCQEITDAAVPPEELIDETTAAALVVAHVATGGDVRGPVLGRTFGEIPERAHAHVGCTVGVSAGEHASQLYRGLVPPESGRLEPGLFRGVRGSARCRGDGTGRFGGRSAGRVSAGMADGDAATFGSDRVGSGRT